MPKQGAMGHFAPPRPFLGPRGQFHGPPGHFISHPRPFQGPFGSYTAPPLTGPHMGPTGPHGPYMGPRGPPGVYMGPRGPPGVHLGPRGPCTFLPPVTGPRWGAKRWGTGTRKNVSGHNRGRSAAMASGRGERDMGDSGRQDGGWPQPGDNTRFPVFEAVPSGAGKRSSSVTATGRRQRKRSPSGRRSSLGRKSSSETLVERKFEVFEAVPRKNSQGEGSSQEDSGFESRGSSVARRAVGWTNTPKWWIGA